MSERPADRGHTMSCDLKVVAHGSCERIDEARLRYGLRHLGDRALDVCSLFK
jgi:hypothetical protein